MNKPLPTMPGLKWQPMEVGNLRSRYPKTCWEPLNRRREVCALPKGHAGRHGALVDEWRAREAHNDGEDTDV